MKLKRIPYTEDLFLPIRDFLVEAYDPDPIHPNWQIDRWNFCLHVSQIIHETTASWPATVGIWVDGSGEIQAVVNSEGENRGEVFFQLQPRDFSDQELGEFLDHAEQKLFLDGEDGLKKIDLHIGPNFIQLARILDNRGYQVAGTEKAGILEISSPCEVQIPDGLRLAVGGEFSDEGRSLAHSLAFGYAREEEDMLEKYHMVEAFQNMRRAPDYRADLDLAILDGQGKVAAFANFWFDQKNRIGILEPLGTVPEYQRLGVARALLSEGINRLRDLGAEMLYGGAGQPFYLKFGFEIIDYREIWRREW